MNTRNTVILSIIGLATMLITIVGASFAYFSSNVDVSAEAPIGVTTNAASAMFMSMATDGISIDVDANEMQQSQANDNTTISGLTDDAVLSVMLTAATNSQVSTCTYDIIYTWSATSSEYVRTTDVAKEFTIEGAVASTLGVATLPDSDPLKADYVINSPALNEINFDEFTWNTKKIKQTNADGVEEEVEVRYTTLVDDAKISSIDASSATVLDWKFTVRFYNATKSQEELRSKVFSGTISVDEDSIKC